VLPLYIKSLAQWRVEGKFVTSEFIQTSDVNLPRSSLEDVTQVAQSVSDRMVTAGVSLDRCSVPKRGKQESLPFNLLEYGMGNFTL
jgi:hypothetical protein